MRDSTALLRVWRKRNFTRLNARDGFEIDLRWQDSEPQTLTVRSHRGGDFRLLLNDGESLVNYETGDTIRQEGAYVVIATAPGVEIQLRFIRRD